MDIDITTDTRNTAGLPPSKGQCVRQLYFHEMSVDQKLEQLAGAVEAQAGHIRELEDTVIRLSVHTHGATGLRGPTPDLGILEWNEEIIPMTGEESAANAGPTMCGCDECTVRVHASDCGVHNRPAFIRDRCDCGY